MLKMKRKKKKIPFIWKPKKIKKHKTISNSIFKPKYKRTKAEKKLIKRNPWGDKDGDLVPNWIDCKPFDRRRQGLYKLPMTKAGWRRSYSQDIPFIVRHNKGELIDVIGRKGVKTYAKVREEKLEDLKKEYPDVDYSVQSQIELERGMAQSILGKGRTPGKIIFKSKLGGKGRVSIVDTKTGDITLYDESSSWTKKKIEEDRKRSEYDEKEIPYNYYSELSTLKEQDRTAELLNKSPMKIIREKREKLREEADKYNIDQSFSDSNNFQWIGRPEKETTEAFKSVTDENKNFIPDSYEEIKEEEKNEK